MRGARGNNCALLSAIVIVILGISMSPIGAQFFDPQMDDKDYMDSIQNEVMGEVKETKEELLEQAKLIQQITKNYIAARLKQNLFKALRVLAEKELQLDAISMQERPRQPRQEEEESGGGDEDSEGPATTRRPSQVIPQVASLIKAVFGGNINLTSYVESAAGFLPKPIGTQLVGVVKLLANNPGYKYTTTTTVPPPTTVPTSPAPGKGGPPGAGPKPPQQEGQTPQKGPSPGSEANPSQAQSPGPSQTNVAPARPSRPRPSRRSTTEPTDGEATSEPTDSTDPTDEDEDELSNRNENLNRNKNAGQRQFNLPGLELLNNVGNTIGGILNGNRNKPAKNTAPVVESSNKTTSGFEEETPASAGSNNNKMSGFDVGSLAKEFRMGLGDLIKVMPDIFRGAHEAYKLLSSVSSLFSRLENEP